MTEAQRAIWRRMTDEQRQRVIDARWEPIPTLYGYGWGSWVRPYQGCDCPLGLALPATGVNNPGPSECALALADTIDLVALDHRAGGDLAVFNRLLDAELSAIAREAKTFADNWDRGLIPPDNLVADLRQMQGAAA